MQDVASINWRLLQLAIEIAAQAPVDPHFSLTCRGMPWEPILALRAFLTSQGVDWRSRMRAIPRNKTQTLKISSHLHNVRQCQIDGVGVDRTWIHRSNGRLVAGVTLVDGRQVPIGDYPHVAAAREALRQNLKPPPRIRKGRRQAPPFEPFNVRNGVWRTPVP